MNTECFRTIQGSIPILLSAPHVYAHKRPSLSMAYKYGEPLTDLIVQEICHKAKTYGIVLTQESDFDANYHKEKSNPYKQKVREVIEKEGIQYFIDIHGIKDKGMYDIAIYYPTRYSKSFRFAEELRSGIERGKLKGASIPIFRFNDNYQEPLGKYTASKLKIPSVQLEVTQDIRESDILRNTLIENMVILLESKSIK